MTEENRRTFIKRTIAAGAGAVGTAALTALLHDKGRAMADRAEQGEVALGKDHRTERPAGASRLAVAEGPGPARNARAAVEVLGGMGAFVKKGETVLVKPNVGWDRTPEQGANTTPEVVGEIVRMCLEAGAGKVIVTDHCCNDPRRAFFRSGIGKAAQEAGAKVLLPDAAGFSNTDLGGKHLGVWPIVRPFLEADRVINCPIAKHHSLTRATLCMKNWYGILGGRRDRLHQEIDEGIAELYAFARPTLSFLDATRVLMRGGPQGGNLGDVERRDTVAAGVDEVALDAFGATLFGLSPAEVGSITAAEKLGLGTSDYESLGPVRVKG